MSKSKQTQANVSPAERSRLLNTLKGRFEKNMQRHKGLGWESVLAKLEANAQKLRSLFDMENTGGEPDVVRYDKATGEFLFADCSAESPAGRRSLCYDREALDARKEAKPSGSAMEMAEAMGISLLTEAEYRYLQSLGPVDQKTSSWLLTPEPIRKLGGAIFGDFRYGQVFIYHNGVQSYYAARGFRGMLRV
jgi:hypothetical protein